MTGKIALMLSELREGLSRSLLWFDFRLLFVPFPALPDSTGPICRQQSTGGIPARAGSRVNRKQEKH